MVQKLPLTLLEELLLLALDDQTGNLHPLARPVFDRAAAGAILMDLILRHRIDNDLHDMFVVDQRPVGDDLLDPALQLMSLSPVLTPRPIGDWLDQLAGEGESLRAKALRRLEERGIVRRENRKILWVFGARRYPLAVNEDGREVRSRILGVVLGDEIPMPRDIMLVSLGEACGLFRHLLSAADAADCASRVAQVAAMDLVGQAVAKSVAGAKAHLATACG